MLRFIFVVYCATVGAVLILAPWTPGWEQLVARLPFPGLRFLELPWLRGGLSGFGLVHLVWGLHDPNELVRHSFKPDEAASDTLDDREHP